jgi:uncharacterized protein YbjQ (UPF0145 family)
MMVKFAAGPIGIAAMVCALCACAGTPIADSSGSPNAGEVKIYDTAQLTEDRYTLVKRLWVDSWRTAVWMPVHANAADGIAALRTEAGRLGANALTGVACYEQGHAFFDWRKEPRFVCYGNAIRLH